jgi:hypothetical protein
MNQGPRIRKAVSNHLTYETTSFSLYMCKENALRQNVKVRVIFLSEEISVL